MKPANIKIGRSGGSLDPPSVKILDFGLARSVASTASSDLTKSPTVLTGTVRGVIMGTVAYMSPEQARGDVVDKRTDIFAFSCVVYECLTGRQAFGGPTMTDSLAATMKSDPDWSVLPANVPAPLRDLLRRGFEKHRRQRLQSIGDARVILQELMTAPDATREIARPDAASSVALRRRPTVLAGIVAALTVGLSIGRFLPRTVEPPSQPGAVRAVLPLTDGVGLGLGGTPAIAISPDGRTVVFRGGTENGPPRLYRRTLDGTGTEAIQGTEGGHDPFFSPDGQWLGFFAQTRIKKVSLAGGAPVVVCEVPPVAAGATWTDDDAIVFSRGPNFPLSRVSPAGGAISEWSSLDAARGEHAHAWPQALPGGRMLVTMVFGRDFQDVNEARAVIVAPGEKPRDIQEGASFARAVPGWLVFVRGDAVLAAPFDNRRLEVTGPPIRVNEPMAIHTARRVAHLAVSADGTLVYGNGSPIATSENQIVRLDRLGRAAPMPLPPAFYSHLRWSPDGRRLALARTDGFAQRLFTVDAERGAMSPFTPEAGRYFTPVWSPDGKRIAYARYDEGSPRIYMKNSDGSDAGRALTQPKDYAEFPSAWSPDGSTLVFIATYEANLSEARRRGTSDIWVLPMDGKSPSHPWMETPHNEISATFSPDGRFLAYTSDESGQREVYVRPYPGPGGRTQVSNHGGVEPTWSANGQEIVYREWAKFLSVSFRASPDVAVSAPRLLFAGEFERNSRDDNPRSYDSSPDGSFIALQQQPREPAVAHLAVVINWTGSLGKGK